MIIKVLGNCCKKSLKMISFVEEAVRELGVEAEIEIIGDISEIAASGVMTTPGLVINEKVVSYGKLIKPKDIVKLIHENQ